MPGQTTAGRAGRCGPSACRTPCAMARVGALTWVVLPCGEATGGGGQGGSRGVCSGQNRASIDLLLLKPELLSGTPQPGCPCLLPGKGCPVCPHQREMGPPKHLATAMACTGFGWQPGHRAEDSVLPLVPTALLPSSWLPVGHCAPVPPQHPRCCLRCSGQPCHPTAGGRTEQWHPAEQRSVYWRGKVIASSGG